MPLIHRCLGITAALAIAPVLAEPMEELVVTATHSTRTIDVTNALAISPDVAQLLKEAPGANVNSNGPLTGIPQYRGMYGSRVATRGKLAAQQGRERQCRLQAAGYAER